MPELYETEKVFFKKVNHSDLAKAPQSLAMHNGSYHRDAIARLQDEFFPSVTTFENTYQKHQFAPLVDLGLWVISKLSGRGTTAVAE